MKIIRVLIVILISATFISCSGAAPIKDATIIRDTIIKIAPPIIIDSAIAKKEYYAISQNEKDSLFQVLRAVSRDTTVDIRYYPKTQMMFWKVKPDTIFFAKRDTMRLVEYKTEKRSKYESFGIFSIGAATAALIILLIYFLRKIKK